MHPLRFPNSGIRAKRRQRGGAASNGQPHAGQATHGQGQPEREANSARKGRQSPAGTAACSATLAKGADCRAPARGYRPRPFLPSVGVATPTAGVVAPWQGGYQRARAAIAYTGAATTTQREKKS
ncbi:hypothetical protein GW17_00041301 [Ensete ventricosum]|nr:hypothetical protein GW17_00041301 [Ensete ventricosum]